MSTFQKIRTEWAWCLVLAAIAILRAVFIVLPSPSFWGVNFFTFLPMEIAVLLSVVSLLGVVWAIMDKGSMQATGNPKFNIFSTKSLIAIPLVAGLLFYFVSVPVALLGDGGQFAGDLYRFILNGQPVSLYKEPLTMWMNAHVCLWLYRFGKITDIGVTYRATGAFFGMIFVVTALKIASNLRTAYGVRVLAFVLLMSCGGTLLFFGYVENYAPQYVMAMLYLALLFHMFRTNGSPVVPGAMLVVCCLLHLQNVLLIPSFVVALGMRKAVRRDEGEQFGKRVYKYAAISVPVLLLVYAYFQWKPVAPVITGGNPFISLMAVEGSSYTLLSPMHIADILWEHLLLAPVALALLAVMLLTARRSIRWTAPEMVCVVIAAMGLESFLIGGNLDLGLARDWDVVASLGPMLTLVLLFAFEHVAQSRSTPVLRSRIVTAAGIVALAGLVGWIAVNVDEESEVIRYKTLVAYHRPAVKPSVTRYGYENLRKMYFQRKDWLNEVATDEIMLGVLPWHFDFQRAITLPEQMGVGPDTNIAAALERITVRLVYTLSDSAMRSERGGEDGAIRIAPPHAGTPSTFGDLIVLSTIRLNQLYARWTVEDALAFSDTIIVHHPKLPYGYELKGWLQFFGKDKDAAANSIRMAFALDTTRAHPLVQLGSYYNFLGNHDSARSVARKALLLDGGYLDAARLLFGTMHAAPVTIADTADVRLIIVGARRSLSESILRHATESDIAQGKRILRDALGAWGSITGKDFD